MAGAAVPAALSAGAAGRVAHPRAIQRRGDCRCGASLDLALALIRRASPELANLTARYLVVDVRTSQSIYSIPDHLAKADPLIEQFERWARGRMAGLRSMGREGAGRQQRTLARRMQARWASRRSPSSRTCG